MTIDANPRRAFLKRAARPVARRRRRALGAQPRRHRRGGGAGAPADYKALVCVFLLRRQRLRQHRGALRPAQLRRLPGACGRPSPTCAADLAATALVPAARRSPGGRQYALAPELAPLAAAVRRRQAGGAAQRRHAGAADHQGAVHRRSRCRCRPSCSRTTTSSRSGRRRRPKARPRAGAAASATCSQPATATRPSPASTSSRQRGLPLGQTARPVPGRHQRPGAPSAASRRRCSARRSVLDARCAR